MVHTSARSNVFLALAAFPRFTVVLPAADVAVLTLDDEDEDEEAERVKPRGKTGCGIGAACALLDVKVSHR